MKHMMEIAHMLTNFVSQKAGLLGSLPFFMTMPIWSRSKEGEKLREGPIEPDQRPEIVSVRLDPRKTETKPEGKDLGQKSALSLIGLMSCFLFSGCTGSTYSGHFDCPMGEGAGCASISRVNKMIDRREIDLGNEDAPLAKGDPAHQALGRQVYIYYGPDQLSRLISADGQEGN